MCWLLIKGELASTVRGSICARGFVVALLSIGLTSCAISKKVTQPVAGTGQGKFTMQVTVVPGANNDSPIAVDLVMIFDKKLVKQIEAMPTKDWFDRRMQIARDFERKLDIASWEWVPGTQTGPIAIGIKQKVYGAFIFANYQNGTENRAPVDVTSPVAITLGTANLSNPTQLK
jgi:type VI secretion system protein